VPERSTICWSRATFLAISLTILGHTLQIGNGVLGLHPDQEIAWLTASIVTATIAMFMPSHPKIGAKTFRLATFICLMGNFVQLITKSPYVGFAEPEKLAPFAMGFVVQALLCGVVVSSDGAIRNSAFAAVLAIFAVLGTRVIINQPGPRIDVYMFQADSSAALADGRNPYDMTFPIISPEEKQFYGDGVVQNGRLQFGYPYFPETLFAVMPADLLHFDVRYTQLAAIIGSAILIAAASPGTGGFAAALLLLTTPRIYFILEESWIEPIVLLTLATTIACAARWPRLLPYAFGIFFASKQYVPVAAVLLFVGSRPLRQTASLLFTSALVASVVTLPMALWNLSAFWKSVVSLQFRQPFRPDALSYLSWVGEALWAPLAVTAIPFALLFLTIGLVLWRRRSMSFASAMAFCFLLFFAFNKQAFANYYFFVIGAMACGIAELMPLNPPSDSPRLPHAV
jgi:hypothetical protein